MRTAFFCVITQQVVTSTEFISGRGRGVISLSSLMSANRVDAGGREGGV